MNSDGRAWLCDLCPSAFICSSIRNPFVQYSFGSWRFPPENQSPTGIVPLLIVVATPRHPQSVVFLFRIGKPMHAKRLTTAHSGVQPLGIVWTTCRRLTVSLLVVVEGPPHAITAG